jgi:hypothetical protein
MIGLRFVRCRANLPRNPTFLRLWSALVVSGCCVSAHEMAATWAINSLGTPVLWLFDVFGSHLTVLSVQVACWRVGRPCRSPPTAWHLQRLAGYRRGPAGLLRFSGRVDPRNRPYGRLSAGDRFCGPSTGGCHMDATKSACFNSASTAPALTGVPSSQWVPSAGAMSSMMPPHLETQVCLLLSANHCQIGSLTVGTNVLH